MQAVKWVFTNSNWKALPILLDCGPYISWKSTESLLPIYQSLYSYMQYVLYCMLLCAVGD